MNGEDRQTARRLRWGHVVQQISLQGAMVACLLLPALSMSSAILVTSPKVCWVTILTMAILVVFPGAFSFLLPSILCAVPWGGATTLAVVLGAFGAGMVAWFQRRRSSLTATQSPLLGMFPLVSLGFGWSVGMALTGVPWVHGGLADLQGAFTESARWASIGAVWWITANHHEQVTRGVVPAALIVVGGAVLQYGGWIPDLRSDYWRGLGRWSGTMSDPNSLGAVAFLLLVLVVAYSLSRVRSTDPTKAGLWPALRWAPVLCGGGALVSVGLLSGSRSFVAGVIGWAGLVTIGWIYRRKGWLGGGATLILGALVLSTGIASLSFVPAEWIPPALVRTQALCWFGTVNDSCSARWWLPRIALWLWQFHPWVGNGPGTFEQYITSGAQVLGIPVGLWVDNATNVYVQLLSEYGLLGIIALVILLSYLKSQRGRCIAWSGVLVFGLLLLVGAFVEFVEVCVLVGVVIGVATHQWWVEEDAGAGLRKDEDQGVLSRTLTEPRVTIACGLVMMGGGLFSGYDIGSYGLLPYELFKGRFERWTAAQARFVVSCREGESSVLLPMRNGSPKRLIVSVGQPSGHLPVHWRLGPGQHGVASVPCQGKGAMVSIRVTPGWRPSSTGHGEDHRLLGIRLELDPTRAVAIDPRPPTLSKPSADMAPR